MRKTSAVESMRSEQQTSQTHPTPQSQRREFSPADERGVQNNDKGVSREPWLPFPPDRKLRLSQIPQLLAFNALEVFFFNQLVDALLDIRDLGREARFDLADGLLHELDVLHLLAGFHDADDSRLIMTPNR